MAECEVPASEIDCLTRYYLRKRCVKYVSSDYQIVEGDDIIVVNGNVNITLPLAFGNEGPQFTVKRLGDAAPTVFPQGAELIDAKTSRIFNVNRYSEDYVSDGQNWIIV
jgi:hypothetical protein